jgi:carboxyl-terminal processing protease
MRSLGLVLAAFAGGATAAHLAHARTQTTSPYDPFDQLAWVLVLVENQYVDAAQRNKVVEGAIKGMVAELDPHSAYMDPREYAEFQSDTEGKFGGVGVEVDFKDEIITIIAPMEGSPAARAGVRPGDQLLAIDGKPVRGERLDKIITLMRGPAGSHVRITLRRPGVTEPLQLDLVREEIHVQSVVGKRLDGDVAYIRLRQFQAGTHEELLRVTGQIRAASPRPLSGVLLDLRNNPGGLVDEAEAVADELLDAGSIYSTRHRGKILDEVKASSGGALSNLPVVALVNEYSASSAELLAGALQDNKRATIIGAPTFGKGSVQTIFDLPGGAGLRLTTMRYYTPSGRSIQAQGIRPDLLVESGKPGASAEVVRESDLDGHLSAEAGGVGAPANANIARAPVIRASENDTGPTREVLDDPTKGTDFVLSVGYKTLRERIGKKP